jgi:hypothetical protein
LSENEDWRVLLIEAGHVETPIIETPLTVAYLRETQFNWQFNSEVQDNACLGRDFVQLIDLQDSKF